MTEYTIGVGLAVGVAALARGVGFDRDRAFYPTMLIVIASYYVLFAVMGLSTRALIVESVGVVGFTVVAVIGFKRSAWLVVAGLAAHGIFDFFHARLVINPGVPEWWPGFCLAFDAACAALLAWMRLGDSAAQLRDLST